MLRIISLVGGVILILLGAISLASPIPGATFMLAAGSVLLICSSPKFRIWMQACRTASPRFNKLLLFIERKVGTRLGGILKLTRPGYEPQPGDHGVK